MFYAVEVILVFQMRFVKSNQQQIIKVSSMRIKFWYNEYFPFAITGELVLQQGLTGSVIVVFFCPIRTSKSKVKNHILL